MRSWLMWTALVIFIPAGAEGQSVAGGWPFEIGSEDMLRVDLTAIEWSEVRTFVGGTSAEVRYRVEEPTEGECRAVGLITAARLRARFLQQTETEPVTLRVDFTCSTAYRGALRFDGVNTYMEVRDGPTRQLLYRERRRGPPSLDQ